VFDEFGFIDSFGGGGADIAPIAFDTAPIADTAWTPSFDSSMMSPEMAMGGAGGFDQVGPIVNALADAGRFDLIPPFLESAGFDTAGFEGMGADPLAPLAQTPAEVPSTAWDAEQSAPSLMSLMMQTPQEAPAILAPWNPMGDLMQQTPPTPLVINPEQQFGVDALTNQELGAQPPPYLGAATGNEYQPSPTGAQSFDESGFSLPPLQHNDGGPFGTQGNVSSSDTQPDFSWVFGGQPETPPVAPSSIINDHFKGYEPLNGAQSFDEGGFSQPLPFSQSNPFDTRPSMTGTVQPDAATAFSPQPDPWQSAQSQFSEHNDGGPPGSRSMVGLSDGPAATFGQPQEQVPLPQPRPSFSTQDVSSYRPVIGEMESSNRYDKLGPVTKSGDQAYGRYGVMGSNIAPWSKDAMGYSVTKQEFLNNPAIQDRVFDHRFGNYVTKYGPEGAAKAWFAGERGMLNPNAKDVLGTSVAGYGDKFNRLSGGARGALAHNDGGPMGARGASGSGEEVAALAPANAESIPIPGVKVVNAVDPNGKFGLSATKNAEPFKSVVFHHTGSDNVQSALNTLKKGDPFRGGGSFGYHYYIDKDGTVYQGAPLNVRTNHVMPSSSSLRTAGDGVDNKNSIGISFVGSGKETPEQIASGTKVAAAVMQQYGIKPDSVFGHGELQKNRESGEGVSAVAQIRSGAVQVAQNQAPDVQAREANKDFSPNKPIPGDQANQIAQNSAARPLEETTVPTRMAQASRVPDTGQRTMYDGDVGGGQGGGFPSLFSSLFGGGQQQGGMPAIMGGGQGGGMRNPFNDPGSLAAMELIVNSLSRAAPIHGLAQSQIQSNQYAEQQASKQAMYMAAKQMGFSDQDAAAFMHNPQAMQMVQQWKLQQQEAAAPGELLDIVRPKTQPSTAPAPATSAPSSAVPSSALSPNMAQNDQGIGMGPAPMGSQMTPAAPLSSAPPRGNNPLESPEWAAMAKSKNQFVRQQAAEILKQNLKDRFKQEEFEVKFGEGGSVYWASKTNPQNRGYSANPEAAQDAIAHEAKKKLLPTYEEDLKAKEKVKAQNQLSGLTDEITGLYLALDSKGAIVNPYRSTTSNIASYMKSSPLGQAFSQMQGMDEASIRANILAARPALINSIRQSTGMSAKAMDSNAELQFYLQQATDPQQDIFTNLAALNRLEKNYGNGVGIMDKLPPDWQKYLVERERGLVAGRQTPTAPIPGEKGKAQSLPKDFEEKPVNDQLNWLQRNAPNGTEFTIKETGNRYKIINGKAVPLKKDNKE
jgi:hypothetical protein